MATVKIRHLEGRFTGAGGINLFRQGWVPKQGLRAVVCLVHGIGEHSGRYEHLASWLAARRFAVETFDLRGHGHSDGPRNYTRSFDRYLEDLQIKLDQIRSEYTGVPLFLLGHSMGGTIVTWYVIREQPNISGLIVSAPSIVVSDDISPVLVRLSSVMGALLPRLPTVKLDTSALSRDPDVVRRYDQDPLVYHRGVRARTGAELFRAMAAIRENMEAIRLPLLIIQGTEDHLVDPAGSKLLYEKVASEDKTLHLYEGFYHESFNDPENLRVFGDLLAWLDARTD